MTCIICDKKFERNILFENESIIIMLAIEPSVNGHIQIFSKEHYTIMEQVPDDIISKITAAANKISMILFEALKVHGTNIIINNGVSAGQKISHFSVDILPRRTDDNLKLDWTLKQAAPEALDSVHRIIEEGMNRPDTQVVEQKRPEVQQETRFIEQKTAPSEPQEDSSSERESKPANFFHKLFERIP